MLQAVVSKRWGVLHKVLFTDETKAYFFGNGNEGNVWPESHSCIENFGYQNL